MEYSVLLIAAVMVVHASVVAFWIDRKVEKSFGQAMKVANKLEQEAKDLIRSIKELAYHMNEDELGFHKEVLKSLSRLEKVLIKNP